MAGIREPPHLTFAWIASASGPCSLTMTPVAVYSHVTRALALPSNPSSLISITRLLLNLLCCLLEKCTLHRLSNSTPHRERNAIANHPLHCRTSERHVPEKVGGKALKMQHGGDALGLAATRQGATQA